MASYDGEYSFLELKMHKAVWLLDKKRNMRIQHRVVAYERHPANPENNKVTLATVLITLQQAVTNADNITMGTFSGDRLADNSVNGDKIANGAVGSGKLADGSVVNSKLGGYAVSSDKIADGSVINRTIGSGAVDTSELSSYAVTNAKIGGNAVDGAKIATDAIINRHLTSGSVATTTCNSTINGYFQDVVSANKMLSGQAQISKLMTTAFFVGQKQAYWVNPSSAVKVLGSTS